MTSQNLPTTSFSTTPSWLTSAQRTHLIAEYYAAVRSLDVEAWGAKFAALATMEDPVGIPPAQGRAEAKQRYQAAVLTFSEINMQPQEVFTPEQSNEAAVHWILTLCFRGDGRIVDNIHGISLFRFNEDGLIESFRAFWNPAVLAGSIAPSSGI